MRNRLEYIYMEYDRWSTADNFVYCIIWVAMTTVLRYMLDTSSVLSGMKNFQKPDTFIPCGENSANVNKSNKCIFFYIYIDWNYFANTEGGSHMKEQKSLPVLSVIRFSDVCTIADSKNKK